MAQSKHISFSFTDNEDEVTDAFAELLSKDDLALKLFLDIIDFSFNESPIIQTQVLTNNKKRIDAVLYSDKKVVIIENKVNDRVKNFQFDHYKNYVEETYKPQKIKLVWIVKNKVEVIGKNAEQALMVSWNNIASIFLKSESKNCVAFAKRLVDQEVSVTKGDIVRENKKIQKNKRGIEILNKILESDSNFIGSVEDNTKTDLSLHVGSKKWSFGYNARIWFYFHPTLGGKFTYHSHIIIYNKDYYSFSQREVEHWCSFLKQHGCEIRRSGFSSNGRPSWNGDYQISLTRNFKLDSKDLIYVYAIVPSKLLSSFDCNDDDAAIRAGVEFLRNTLSLVDELVYDYEN